MAKAASSDSSPAKPIIDVAHPSKTVPSNSSRSIIVTNRPLIQDPDVTEPTQDSDSLAGPPMLDLAAKEHKTVGLPPSQKKVVITPPGESKSAAKESAGEAVKVTVKSAQAADSIPVTPEEEPKSDPKETSKPTEEAKKPEPADKPAVKTEAPEDEEEAQDAKPLKDEKQLAAEAAQAAKVAELVKRQVYVLPINAVEKRRSKHIVIGGLLLIVVLAFAWLDLAADAGFIHVPHLPLTHFFRV